MRTVKEASEAADKLIPPIVDLEKHPDYIAEFKKLQGLEFELQQTYRLLNEASGELVKRRKKTVEDFARELLADDKSTITALEPLETDIGKLNDRKKVLGRAIEIQKETLQKVRYEVSKKVVAECSEAHKKVVRQILVALVDAANAMELEQAIREKLMRADYALPNSMMPFTVSSVGFASDYHGGAAYRVREAIQCGIISHDDPIVSEIYASNGNEDFIPEARERRRKLAEKEREDRERADRRSRRESQAAAEDGYGDGAIGRIVKKLVGK
jgi:hypothetical protein